MFGYILINRQELKMKDYDKYRSYYCGLCHTLKDRYKRTGQLLLNYDMTFLAMLLSALYEEAEQQDKGRCLPHPARSHQEIITAAQGYAADMTILLGYQKALDDWKDEHSHPGRLLAMQLYPYYRKLREEYPRQARSLEKNVRRLSECEKAETGGLNAAQAWQRLDEISALTGSFLGEMFAWKEDIWEKDLREMGFFLGKFIYLADAYDDLKKDEEKNRPNPLKALPGGEQADDLIMEALEDMMMHSASAFERLPILLNADILRNILYSGVWVKVAQRRRRRREEKQDQTRLEKGKQKYKV